MEKTIKNTGFIQIKRNDEILNLIRKRPSAFLLLTLIAFRARRTKENQFDGLEIGEAYIGDYQSYCATLQVYRTDKKFLETNGIITTRATNRGTIAKLNSTSLFDINAEELTIQPTNYQHAVNKQLTTNNNDKNVNNANNTNNKSQIKINEEKSLSNKEQKVSQTPKTINTRGLESMREVLERRGILPKGVKQNDK